MNDVYANGRTILHKGDGLTQTSGPPDVCKTPSPGGPVPILYPNAAMDRDLDKGSKHVKIAGNSVAHADANIRTSTGDEPGTAGGGVMSAKTKGKLTFGSTSIDVKVEGKGIACFLDVTHHNGNMFNTVLAAAGKVGVDYTNDPIDQFDCAICKEPKSKHRLAPMDDILAKASALRKALQAPGGPFMRVFVRGGNSPNPDRPLKPGLMIGALSCQCDARKQYAGLSGRSYHSGNYLAGARVFEAEAGKLGLIPVVTPPPSPPLSGFHPPVAPGTAFGAISGIQWAATRAREAKVTTDHRGNAVLTCAAPKMIQKCLADGHKPGTLVEVWVAFEDPSPVTVTKIFGVVLDTTVDPPRTRTDWLHETTFGDGDVVPSCTTCQVTCSEMVCYTGKPPCP